MALSSSSTLTDALAQYNNNLDWEGSTAKAALALEAIRWLLVNRPTSMDSAGTSVNFAALETEKAKLELFVASASTSARSSFTRGRAIL